MSGIDGGQWSLVLVHEENDRLDKRKVDFGVNWHYTLFRRVTEMQKVLSQFADDSGLMSSFGLVEELG